MYDGEKATLEQSAFFCKTELVSFSLKENFINAKIGEKAVYFFICAVCCQIFYIVTLYKNYNRPNM